MSTSVDYNRIPQVRALVESRTRGALEDAAQVTEVAAKAGVPIGPYAPHIIDSIEASSVLSVPRGHQVHVTAGDDTTPYPWFIEAGTGRYFDPPETEDPYPAGGRQTPWVYYNPDYGTFFTTEGNKPQPFLGPAYELGRTLAERALSRVVS